MHLYSTHILFAIFNDIICKIHVIFVRLSIILNIIHIWISWCVALDEPMICCYGNNSVLVKQCLSLEPSWLATMTTPHHQGQLLTTRDNSYNCNSNITSNLLVCILREFFLWLCGIWCTRTVAWIVPAGEGGVVIAIIRKMWGLWICTYIPLTVGGFSHAYSLLLYWFLVPLCLINILHYLH